MSNAKFPDFVRSTEYRRELGMKRKRAIKKMYSDIAKETENKINAIQRAGKWTGTTVLQMKQLRDLQKSIDDSLKNISAQIEKDIVSDMKKVAEVTCSDVAGMMKRIGVNVGAAYAHVPELAVKNIVSGNLYGQRWNFSKAVWGDYRKASGDLAQIVAKGLAQNRPIYDIAKDLEKYVNPNVRKDFDWSRRYPGSKKKVDYNAYRLAQTMSTHAHQQAVILSCKDDPLIDGVEWRSSGGVNVCPLCEQRNGEVFPLDKCPMDHPMGACILVPHFKGTKIDEKTGKLIEPDFHSEAAKVDGDELRKEFEAEKARLRAEREAKKATSVNNTASSTASVNNAAEKLSQIQKASDELGKAIKDFGKSVDGFEKAVGNLQNAAKGLTSVNSGGIINTGRSAGNAAQNIRNSFPHKIGTIDFNDKKAITAYMQKFENKFAHKEREYCLVITKTGNMYVARGGAAGIDTDSIFGDKMLESYNTHTHPPDQTEYSFSTRDIFGGALDGTAVMRAADTKYCYEIHFNGKKFTEKEIIDIINTAEDSRYDSYDAKGYTMAEFAEKAEHSIIEDICEMLGVEYKRWKKN